MKRLNPKTGKTFKHGDIGDDGRFFIDYRKTRPIKKDGYFQENWAEKDRFLKIKAHCRKTGKRWKQNNPERVKEQKRKHYEKFPEKYVAKAAKRRAAKLLRTPKWLTADDLFFIEEAYHLAKLRTELTAIQYHVDHILPLQGQKVSGLHVPNNLQVIPAKINLQKSNKHE